MTSGTRVELDCTFSGDTPDNFTWTHNQAGDVTVVSSSRTLVFSSVSSTDAGEYTCSIAGRAADLLPVYHSSGSIQLLVEGKPAQAVIKDFL